MPPMSPGMRCRFAMPHVSVRPRRFSGGDRKEKPYVDTVPATAPVRSAPHLWEGKTRDGDVTAAMTPHRTVMLPEVD